MMLLSLHIVAIAALAGICGSIGYQMGVKEGNRSMPRINVTFSMSLPYNSEGFK